MTRGERKKGVTPTFAGMKDCAVDKDFFFFFFFGMFIYSV